MARKSSRRDFFKHAAMAGAGFWVAGGLTVAESASANEKLDIGVIGVHNQGEYNLTAVGKQNIVALCDIDDKLLGTAGERFPSAAKHNDFRKMLDKEKLDAVVVSTPDHVHAVASIMAMRRGKHVYCEKPLTHSVAEARLMKELAAKKKLATQMGTQNHALDQLRRTVEVVQSGALGKITEVHAWANRNFSGGDRPDDKPAVPKNIHWDLWIGPAPERPYHPAYMPFKWRGWWDFGTGSLGDMACHIMDIAFWGLKLGLPTSVVAEGPAVHAESTPKWCIVHYEFPARDKLPPVKLVWYDGGKLPSKDLFEGEKVPSLGLLFIGSKGKLLVPYFRNHQLLPKKKFKDFEPPKETIPKSPGHHAEWIKACKDGSATGSNFDYASIMTESVLLGNVAFRAGKKIEWDAEKMKATNCPEADKFIQRKYRKGWSLEA